MEIFEEFLKTNVLKSVVIVLFAVIVFALVSRIFGRIKKSGPVSANDDAKRVFMSLIKIIKTIYIFLVIILILDVNGINVTSLVASLGIAGAVVALAAQDLMKDIISGIYITTERMFSIGDIISYNGEEGEVLDFSLRSTKVRNFKGRNIVFISNRNISDALIIEGTDTVDLPLPYELTISQAEEVCLVIEKRANELEIIKEAKYLGPDSFEGSYISYKFLVSANPKDKYDAKRALRKEMLLVLESRGIAIPYEKIQVLNNA